MQPSIRTNLNRLLLYIHHTKTKQLVILFEFFDRFPEILKRYPVKKRERTVKQNLGLIINCKLEDEFQFFLEEKILINV